MKYCTARQLCLPRPASLHSPCLGGAALPGGREGRRFELAATRQLCHPHVCLPACRGRQLPASFNNARGQAPPLPPPQPPPLHLALLPWPPLRPADAPIVAPPLRSRRACAVRRGTAARRARPRTSPATGSNVMRQEGSWQQPQRLGAASELLQLLPDFGFRTTASRNCFFFQGAALLPPCIAPSVCGTTLYRDKTAIGGSK